MIGPPHPSRWLPSAGRTLPTARIAAVLLAAALAALPAHAQSSSGATDTRRIAGVDARPGAATRGWLAIPPAADSGTRLPITVIRGRRAGPTLALVAGTMGGKTAPIVALQQVRDSLDPAALRGTVILVHVSNPPSFHARTPYRGPWDHRNLNRVYPGRVDGSISERIAHAITTQVIAPADYLIDLQAGDANEAAARFVYSARPGIHARTDSMARQMAIAWGSPFVVLDRDGPRDPARSFYLQTTAHLHQVPALTTVLGGMGVADSAAVAGNVQGILRVLRALEMLPSAAAPAARRAPPTYLVETDILTSPATGTWRGRVAPGDTLAAAALLGTVHDYWGDVVAEVRAPWAGVVLYVVATPATSAGEPLVLLGRPGRP